MVRGLSPICNFKLKKNYINSFTFPIYLSIPARLLPVTWDYNLRRSIIGLYYLLHTKNINLNSITADQPGFEPGSLGPKATTLPLCYAPLTDFNIVYTIDCSTTFHRAGSKRQSENAKLRKLSAKKGSV